GSLLDIGIYPIFLALHTLGKPEKISAKAQMSSTNVDEVCEVQFEYANGAQAELHSSIVEHTPTAAEFVLENAVITIHSRWHEPSTVSIKTSEGSISKSFEVVSHGYEYEAAHVQEMLRQGKTESDVMSFEKSLELISMLDRVRKEIELEY
ncbi:MAG: gfo/Idh/MocA family oxidoreductase, partial [Salinimicrobium sp.]